MRGPRGAPDREGEFAGFRELMEQAFSHAKLIMDCTRGWKQKRLDVGLEFKGDKCLKTSCWQQQ